MNLHQSLTILIPAYNEEARIGRTLNAYLQFYDPARFPHTEILVVLNGCRDNTAVIVREYAARHRNLHFLEEHQPIGKGGALMLGFREAKSELIGFVDADNSITPEAFQKIVEALGADDAVIGSRWLPGAVVHPRQPLLRRIASRVFNRLVRLLFGVNASDTQCGAKVFRSRVVQTVLPHIQTVHWAFDVDLLFQCQRHGFRVREVPTVWSDSAGSRLKIAKASWQMFLAILRLRLVYSPFQILVAKTRPK